MIASMSESRTYSESIRITADPETVYATVSDVTRTGEWSPICRECWWDEGDSPQVGAWFTGRNVTPTREWKTRSKVIAAEPGRRFAWSVGDGYVLWSYSMQAVDGGTELTESWEFTPLGHQFFTDKYGDDAENQRNMRTADAHKGIPETLAAIKRVIEQQ